MAKRRDQSGDLLETLGDFTSKENWDNFFTIRGGDDSFEWYAEWPQLRDPLLSHLSSFNESPASTDLDQTPAPAPPQILVPGCGNSRLSEHLYDAGYRGITNIDFSKVVISEMLRRNVRMRPDMRWRIMDMTAMQFTDEAFEAVIDKGGLDALMEPELGSKLGSQYLSEVKRVLKLGGRFICFTLGESHVLGLLFSKLRFGWKMNLHAIPQKSNEKPNLQTFMVVAEKDSSIVSHQIIASFTHASLDCNSNQACGLYEALEHENGIRKGFACGCDITYSLEDLHLGAKGDLTELSQGRRVQLTMGDCGDSRFSYSGVLLDAREDSGPFVHRCGVFLVPKCRAHEWLFSSEEGQWVVVESSKAARLIMVLLDASHTNLTMDDIMKDLSPLVKQLAPGKDDNDARISFMIASDGIKQRKTVHQVTSTLTGSIIIEDVMYENLDGDNSHLLASKDLVFRRLTFQRSQGLVQSEALLIRNGSSLKFIDETERKKSTSSPKSKKKVKQRRSGSHSSTIKESSDVEVDHNYLASSYHTGIISGFMLISSYLSSMASTGRSVKTVVIGLGAGLLPMFLHRCMPFLHIEVVELDAMVLEVAKDYFSFIEDERLKVHIADGIQFVREAAKLVTSSGVSLCEENTDAVLNQKYDSCDGSCGACITEDKAASKIDIIIIDVDSMDSSSGMTCPAADFVEEPFLLTVKEALTKQGLFLVNLVSRSSTIKDAVISRMKLAFSHLFCLELEEDVNVVLFALNTDACLEEDQFEEATHQLEKLVKFEYPERSPSIVSAAKKIKCLK